MTTTCVEKGKRELRRAPRYSIVAPLRFRTGWGQWLEATTVNISRLGVLVRTERPSAPSTRLEMRIDLTSNDSLPGALVVCCGHVVRSEPTLGSETLMAVTIDDFQLQPAVYADESGSGTHDSST
jgi:hypothetical protein